LHPEIRTFDLEQEGEALRWLAQPGARHDGELASTAAGRPIEGMIADIADGR
jgi:hypothetical protein